jgi:hypothetical protein
MNIINQFRDSAYLIANSFFSKPGASNAAPIAAAVATCVTLGSVYYAYKQRALVHSLSAKLSRARVQRSQARFDQAFASFPQDQMWRLFIDWKRQQGGSDCFDVKEPGYRAAMEKAFSYVRDTLGKRLDAKEYCHLHDLCVDSVTNELGKRFTKGFFRYSMMGGLGGPAYGFFPQEIYHRSHTAEEVATPEAIEEAYQKGLYSGYRGNFRGQQFPDASRFLAHYDDNFMRSLACKHDFQRKINQIFDNYYEKIAIATSDKEKRAAIDNCCQALEVYHVFDDGNQRTVAFALLLKLLLENGLSPAILEDPILFDGQCTTAEMDLQVEQGQKRFNRIKEHYISETGPISPQKAQEIDQGILFRRSNNSVDADLDD